MNNKEQNVEPTSVSGNGTKPIVVRSCFLLKFVLLILKFFYLQYLRSVGKQWLCPAYILPLFFKTPDERVTPRNLLDSVECPTRGNNWAPAQPDSVERHALFPYFLFSSYKRCVTA